jgi:hypothetical protein
MVRKHNQKPMFPVTLTLAVVSMRGEMKFKILREQTERGTVLKGSQVVTRSIFSAFSVELIAPEPQGATLVDTFEPVGGSLRRVVGQSFEITEDGGHNNGSHSLKLRGRDVSPMDFRWLNAKHFSKGQIVVVTGYRRSLKWGGSPHECDLAKL